MTNKPEFKEDPREWRKSALLSLLGLEILGSLIGWRHHLPRRDWECWTAMLVLIAIVAAMWPRLFRGWYRFSVRLGFYINWLLTRCVLMLFFIFVLTPFGWVLRVAGKDALRLKKPKAKDTYWTPSRDRNPLDQLF